MYKAYASYFAAYLLNSLQESENIRKIILFGSAARNEISKGSDIDIFIDIKKDDKRFKQKVEKILEEFYQSREALLFKSKGISNPIHLIIGKIEGWTNLKGSIESTGIVMYGNYISSDIKGKKHLIIIWNHIEKNRGSFLNKIYGFKVKNKKYLGILEAYKGIKLGKSSIMIPIEYKEDFLKLIKQHKVHAKNIEVYY